MSNILWKWNETDVSQFDTGSIISIRYGNALPFTGSLFLEKTELQGEPALRLFGNGNVFNKGGLFKINNLTLPNRYCIQFEFLSNSVNSLATTNFQLNFAICGNFDSGDAVIATRSSCIFFTNWTGSLAINNFGLTGLLWRNNNFYQCFVNMKPSSVYPSGAFHFQGARYGFQGDDGGALMQADQTAWRQTGLGLLSSSWRGVEMNDVGIGVGSYGEGGSFTGSIWLRDIRILKHPLDLEFDNY